MPRKSLYSVHPSVAYAQAIINNLPEKTGKSLDAWLRLIKKSAPRGEKERREWLKQEYKLGGTTVALILAAADGKGAEDTDAAAYLKAAPGYVENMYAGSKAALRPLHDALVELGMALGEDVKVCPCETIVPLYRKHVFAQIKPATRTRIDFGLALKGVQHKLSQRLRDTGGLAKGDRITHCFAIEKPEDIDTEVKRWLRLAYDLDA